MDTRKRSKAIKENKIELVEDFSLVGSSSVEKSSSPNPSESNDLKPDSIEESSPRISESNPVESVEGDFIKRKRGRPKRNNEEIIPETSKHFTKETIWRLVKKDIDDGKLTHRQIAKKYGISSTKVHYWRHREIPTSRKRIVLKRKINDEKMELIREWATRKTTGVEQASTRVIARKLTDRFKNRGFSVGRETVRKALKSIGKCIKTKTVFLLKDRDKENRLRFAKYITENKIQGKEIFFTD